MNSYEQWLTNNNCCCNGASTITPDCDKDCSCEAIYLEIDNLKTDVNKLSGDVENIEVDLSDYYTKEETDLLIPTEVSELTNDAGYITGVDLSNYATLQDIPVVPTSNTAFTNDAGYLTEHQPLKTINGEVISGSGNIVIEASGGSVTIDDHMDSASTNPVENKVIVDALNGKLDASAYTPVSLSGYATEQWVEDKHYITGVDLSDYALKSEIPTVPTSNSAFTNDMHYITSAETANYVTSGNVETQITNHFWCGTQNEYNALPTKSNNVLYLIHE